jgi:hypothetical protein
MTAMSVWVRAGEHLIPAEKITAIAQKYDQGPAGRPTGITIYADSLLTEGGARPTDPVTVSKPLNIGYLATTVDWGQVAAALAAAIATRQKPVILSVDTDTGRIIEEPLDADSTAC